MRKRVSGIFVSVLVTVFTFCILCTVFEGRKVNADPGMWCSGSPWDIGSDEYAFNFGFWGVQSGDTINFSITFDVNEVFVTDSGSVFNVADGGNTISGSVTYDPSVSEYVMHVRVMATSLSVESYSVTSVTAATPPPPPPPPTNPPPPGPGPGPAPTTPTTPTTRPTAATTAAPATAASTAATTAATAAATTTTKPAADEGGATPVVTTTAAPAAGGEVTTPAQPDTTTAATDVTTSDTSETIEESTDETLEETSEETTVPLDIPTSPSEELAGAVEETSETYPPTPTPLPLMYDAGIREKHFPWWLLIICILVVAVVLRYRKLAAQDMYMDEIIYEFIPGRVIGNIADKIRPPKAAPVPEQEEEKPKVVNGYLQTSNTRVIRPEFSNVAAINKAKELEKGKDTNGELPGIKPPVKRPKNASVDHATGSDNKTVEMSKDNEQKSD